jgi:hypothetical protein
VAHHLEHGHVGDGVRVGVAGVEVDAPLLGDLPHALGLVGAVGVEVDAPGVAALVVDGRPGGDGLVDPEVAGQGQHDLLG